MESVLYGHRMSLRTKTAYKAAHAIAPQANSVYTPVLLATGDVNEDGFRRLTFMDVLRLKRRYDDLDVDREKRFLVLTPRHTEDLILEDKKAFKDILELKDGQPSRLAGFGILEFSKTPYFNPATLQKKPFGEAVTANDAYSSFSFHGDEVMRADGNPYMYIQYDDPQLRGTVIGFDKRFICLPIRNKAMGAIISVKPS